MRKDFANLKNAPLQIYFHFQSMKLYTFTNINGMNGLYKEGMKSYFQLLFQLNNYKDVDMYGI